MRKLMIFFTLIYSISILSQNTNKKDSISAIEIKLLNTNYKDFVVVNKLIYALTKGDSLVVLNLKKENIKFTKQMFSAIALNSKNKIIGVSVDGIVKIQNEDLNFTEIDKVEGKIYNFLIDKNDDFIVLTDVNIRYKKQNYIPEKKSVMYGNFRKNTNLIPPDYIFLDKLENLWISYDFGEWGGNTCFFNLKTKNFIYDNDLDLNEEGRGLNKKDRFKKLKIKYPDLITIKDNDTLYKFPYGIYIPSGIKGVAYDNLKNIIISLSSMYFSIDGSLKKIMPSKIEGFYKSCFDEEILNQEPPRKNENGKIRYRQITEYLGPIAFNNYNNSMHYYSSDGFYKLDEKNCKFSKKFIFKPWIIWTAGLPNAVGYQMNVTKFDFLSKIEIVFLTSNNGIGYFNGEKVRYFK